MIDLGSEIQLVTCPSYSGPFYLLSGPHKMSSPLQHAPALILCLINRASWQWTEIFKTKSQSKMFLLGADILKSVVTAK